MVSEREIDAEMTEPNPMGDVIEKVLQNYVQPKIATCSQPWLEDMVNILGAVKTATGWQCKSCHQKPTPEKPKSLISADDLIHQIEREKYKIERQEQRREEK